MAKPIKTLEWHYQVIQFLIMLDSPWLVDFTIGLVNSVFNLPDGKAMFFEEFE